MNQVINPYLPLCEYIPDGEPHVFKDRVYLFGSHDEEGSDTFCRKDYVFWSAPADHPDQWTNNGVNYRAVQDPLYEPEKACYLFAPDVCQGNDGRYYLYYCLAGHKGNGGYSHPISVAVCDTPDGKYEYLGYVRKSDGSPYMRYICFDPAVINDDGVIRLYYGTCYPFEEFRSRFTHKLIARIEAAVMGRPLEEFIREPQGRLGAVTVELYDDMLTVRSEAKRVIPPKTRGTDFEGHAFFEGSSIRKINGMYYFIWSSILNHELCYAVSRYPDRDFRYGGTIISTGDVGYEGRKAKDRLNHTGTTHGSIECINGHWYVFYHRMSHSSGYSRQACAEKIETAPDGSIAQVRVTSCGLNGKGLKAEGIYPAAAACVLSDGKMEHTGNGYTKKTHPAYTNAGNECFITDIAANTLIGFRSFVFEGKTEMRLCVRGNAEGVFEIRTQMNGPLTARIRISPSEEWKIFSDEIPFPDQEADLYMTYKGKGSCELQFIQFEQGE